jgi:hypothetical protein
MFLQARTIPRLLIRQRVREYWYIYEQMTINTTHIRHIFMLSTWPPPPPPRFHSRMKCEKRAGSFLGINDLEEGKGHWKDTLREGFEESLEGFLRIEGRPRGGGFAGKVLRANGLA